MLSPPLPKLWLLVLVRKLWFLVFLPYFPVLQLEFLVYGSSFLCNRVMEPCSLYLSCDFCLSVVALWLPGPLIEKFCFYFRCTKHLVPSFTDESVPLSCVPRVGDPGQSCWRIFVHSLLGEVLAAWSFVMKLYTQASWVRNCTSDNWVGVPGHV